MTELNEMWAFLNEAPSDDPSTLPERLELLSSHFSRFCSLRADFVARYQEAKAAAYSSEMFDGLKSTERKALEDVVFCDLKKEEASFDYLAKAFYGAQECLKSASFLQGQLAKLHGVPNDF